MKPNTLTPPGTAPGRPTGRYNGLGHAEPENGAPESTGFVPEYGETTLPVLGPNGKYYNAAAEGKSATASLTEPPSNVWETLARMVSTDDPVDGSLEWSFDFSIEHYDGKCGPGASERDEDLIVRAANLVMAAQSRHTIWPKEAPTEEQIRDTILTALNPLNKHLKDNDLPPIYQAALAKLPPPPPERSPFYRAWTNMLHEAIRNEWRAEETAREATKLTPPPFIRLGETREMDAPEDDYVIGDGILTRGGKLMLYGYSGGGKTTLLDHAAASLASGREFLGVHPIDRPHKLLYVQGELTQSEVVAHGQDLLDAFDGTEAQDNLIFWRNTQLPLPDGEQQLRDAITATGASILILDPFNRFFRGDNSMTQEQVGAVFRMIDRLLEDPDLGLDAAIISHHMNVSRARMAGSYDFEGWPSTILRIDALTGLPNRRKLTYEKVRAPGSEYMGKSFSIELGTDGYTMVQADRPTEPQAGPYLIWQALVDLGGEATRKQLVEAGTNRTNHKSRAVATFIAQAIKQQLIAKGDRLGKEQLYRIVRQPGDAPDTGDTE
jgi:hypothetical protein